MNTRIPSATAMLGTIYIIAFVVTFGHAHANYPLPVDGRHESDIRVLKGLFSASFWPLYWSAELFEREDGE